MAKARFFYALRPDPVAAEALATIAVQAAATWGGRAFAAPDIHLTLAFVGMLPIEQQPSLQAILHGLPARCEQALALSRLGSFGHGVLWIGPADRSDSTASARGFAHALAQELRARLRAAEITFDERPLKLHATIVRGARGFADDRRRESADASVAGNARADRPAANALPVVARAWSLALGASDAASTPLRRYRWWSATEAARPS